MPKKKNRASTIKTKYVWLLIVLACLVRLVPVLLGSEDQDDMMLYRLQAAPVLDNLNVYQLRPCPFPYAPVSLFIPVLCVWISRVFQIPFQIVMKAPALLGDLLIVVALYMVCARMKEESRAMKTAALYALSPVAILISAFHGNLMSLPVFLSFMAYAVLLFDEERHWRLSALLLGLAIGFRGYPALLLPFFFIKLRLSLREKIYYCLYCIVPVLISFIPFAILNYRALAESVMGYSGFPDYGFVAIIRAFLSLKYHTLFFDITGDANAVLLRPTKILFFLAYLAILCLARRRRLIDSVLAVFLAFYFIYGGVASQYLVWILPFALLAKDPFFRIYSLSATAALFFYYFLYNPRILFGIFQIPLWPLRAFIWGELFALILFWLVCGFWMVRLLVKKPVHSSYL